MEEETMGGSSAPWNTGGGSDPWNMVADDYHQNQAGICTLFLVLWENKPKGKQFQTLKMHGTFPQYLESDGVAITLNPKP